MNVTVQEQPATGSAARMTGVIMSPGPTMQEIVRRPSWIAPMALYLLVLSIAFGVYAMKADWVAILTTQIERYNLSGLAGEDEMDKHIRKKTEDIRKRTQAQLALANGQNVVGWSVMVFHFFLLVYTTLFVMMGALAEIKLGRAWLNFLACLGIYLGVLGVAGLANTVFKDAPQSALLLSTTATLCFVGAWGWLLDRHTRRNPELHRMLGAMAHAWVIFVISSFVLLLLSLLKPAPIETPADQMVRANLAAVADTGLPALNALLSWVDVFSIWCYSVMAIGFRAATRLSTGIAFSITFLPYALFAMFHVAFKAISG
ncbi:MAG TPA: hypothetical protein VJV23_03660 [Candidatus Polarisedimenticolia bacterium]|nr:hypothetical protein [Candidatus Polarisedimenticolia bacterium]